MKKDTLDAKTRRALRQFAEAEITEHYIYARLAMTDPVNLDVLYRISNEELTHYRLLCSILGEEVQPNRGRIFWYTLLAKTLGVTFAVKLMEGGENGATHTYRAFDYLPSVQKLADDEARHEKQLIDLLSEERLNYMGSVVLGLSDALVEFTGALAGFTFALQNPKLVALTGAITGIAAALSMGSSEYLSSKTENDGQKHPFKAALYTSGAYIITVGLLVAPFALLSNVFAAMGVMLVLALIVIASFTFYYSVAKSEPFKKRFIEMACLSFGVAAVSFIIGYLLKSFTGIEA